MTSFPVNDIDRARAKREAKLQADKSAHQNEMLQKIHDLIAILEDPATYARTKLEPDTK